MVQGTRRTGFTDAALVRLLARLNGPGAGGAAAGFADQLAGWFRWTDAPALFDALQDAPAPPPPADDADLDCDSAEADCRHVHQALARAIVEQAPWVVRPLPRTRRPHARPTPAPMETIADFPFYRRHLLARQQDMEDGIAPARARLRTVLAARAPALARLAALDTVMERVLGAQERRLLATLPALLEKRFARLQAEARAAAPAGAPAADGAWQQHFQQELQAVLQAELDLRWQPIEGLLAALRTAPQSHAGPPPAALPLTGAGRSQDLPTP